MSSNKTFSALLALCEVNPPVTVGFPSQSPVMRSFDVFFDLRLNKLLRGNSRAAGNLRRHRAHYDVHVMSVIQAVVSPEMQRLLYKELYMYNNIWI